MNSQLLFLTMCIPTRIIFALLPNYNLVKKLNFNVNPKLFYTIVGLVFLAIAIVFLHLYFTNERLNASEAGGYTWWHNLRLLHGLLYLCASLYILWNVNDLEKIKLASLPLAIDVLVGLGAFFRQRYI